MRKIQIGDVFEITTPKGKSYFQYVYGHKTIGELIRILPELYQDEPKDMLPLVAEKELYFVHFPLKAAYKSKIVKLIGDFKVPSDLILPQKMRTKHIVRGEFICWHIVDYETWKNESVKELTENQKNFRHGEHGTIRC